MLYLYIYNIYYFYYFNILILFLILIVLSNFIFFYFFKYCSIYGFFLSLFFSFILLFFISFFFYIYNIYNILFFYIDFYNIIILKNLQFNISFFTDNISFLFYFLIIFIGFFSYIYSFYYMKYEPRILIFVLLLILFLLNMIFLVFSHNLITFFLFWEFIGISSYFLINFWIYKGVTFKSSLKAMSFNKFSDACLFIFIFLYLYLYNTNNIILFNYQIYLYTLNIFYNYILFDFNEILCLFLVLCSFCKSAQIGLHFWLPDSMEAPVPASALIHSATLVSAGIYFILRFKYLLVNTYFILYVYIYITIFSSLYSAIICVNSYDLKKILAYSTISNCSLIFIFLLFFNNNLYIYYFYNHGLYKALSFFIVGLLINESLHYQDIKKISGVLNFNFSIFLIFLYSLLNLCGLFFSFGFFIKHLFLDLFIFHNTSFNFIYLLVLLSIIFSLFYGIKIIYYCFFFIIKNNKNIIYIFFKKKYVDYVFILFLIYFVLFIYLLCSCIVLYKLIYSTAINNIFITNNYIAHIYYNIFKVFNFKNIFNEYINYVIYMLFIFYLLFLKSFKNIFIYILFIFYLYL